MARRTPKIGYSRGIMMRGRMQPSTSDAFSLFLEQPAQLDVSISSTQIHDLIQAGYIHSTIAGFNEDYEEYKNIVDITTVAKTYKIRARQDLESALQRLDADASPEMTQKVWGNIDPNIHPGAAPNGLPTLDNRVVAWYMLQQSPAALVSQEWIQSYEKWQETLGKYYKKSIAEIKDCTITNSLVPAAWRVRNAALALADTINKYMQLAQQGNIQQNTTITKNVPQILQHLQTFNPTTDKIGDFNSQLVALSRYFGLKSETMRDVDLLVQLEDPRDVVTALQNQRFKIVPVAGGNALSDVVFEVEVPGAQEPSLQRGGISYKLRTHDQFSLSASFTPDQQAEEDLQYIVYLYSNILALTEFARDKEVNRTGVGKRVQASSGARYNRLVRSLGKPAASAILDFRDFIVDRLLLTAFFGNYADAHSTSPIDLEFFDKLESAYTKPNKAPPIYIMTARHVYRTADVLKHYLTLGQKDKEWKNLIKQQMSPSEYSYITLQHLWQKKSDLLSKAQAANVKQNVYDIFLAHLDEVCLHGKKKRGRLSFAAKHSIRL